MTRLDEIKVRRTSPYYAEGCPLGCQISASNDDIGWLIAEVERLRELCDAYYKQTRENR